MLLRKGTCAPITRPLNRQGGSTPSCTPVPASQDKAKDSLCLNAQSSLATTIIAVILEKFNPSKNKASILFTEVRNFQQVKTGMCRGAARIFLRGGLKLWKQKPCKGKIACD